MADVLLLLVSMIGVAAFGHLLNDWFDIEADAAGNKPNRLANLQPQVRALLVAGSIAVGLLPWLVLDARTEALQALAVEVGLLVIYSAPPIRLKGRAWAGAVADASYAYAVPFLLVVWALGPDLPGRRGPALLAALFTWGLVLGLRGILWHQLGDLEADRAADVGTLARRLGVSRSERLLAAVFLPVELLSFVAVLVLADISWLWWLVPGFLVWRTFQVTFLWSEPIVLSGLAHPRRLVDAVGFEFGNNFIERWLPLAALVGLAWESPWWWVAVFVHFVLFRTALRTFLTWDIWTVPDGVERMIFARRARQDVRVVKQRRLDRMAAGPDHLDDPTARRWVFVVCGPSSHVETLRTALRHLRPVTAAEIWVLTDSRRNAIDIADDAIDHVVDIETPAHLDDHQASIWLKTSVHRRLPAGEWCYLDSDIIAIAPGIEGVFDQRHGPVAFASDVTIRENSVDRFSPWAMTCACRGFDDEHSCTHLREQLTERFGLDVPGEWLHWNGGVFVFGPDSAEFLDMWHERSVASFDWPEWKTRDQGALISTVWSLGLQDLPRLPPEFNFIADLGNHDLCLDLERGWAHHPSGPWCHARLLHLYTSALEDPTWNLGRDVEAVVLGRSRVRVYRYERAELQAKAKDRAIGFVGSVRRLRWPIQIAVETVIAKCRRFIRRLTPMRLVRAIRIRLGHDPDLLPIPGLREPEPQRTSDRRA